MFHNVVSPGVLPSLMVDRIELKTIFSSGLSTYVRANELSTRAGSTANCSSRSMIFLAEVFAKNFVTKVSASSYAG
ncbi:hypothetical protein C8N31_108200 [Sulfitobacter mediterraneus]|uniref:Uncharacterized protein n=1 Tax=Sulfitobacter mediterraneus TaxID=83219 RepID=A0A2T6CCQ0_9RHOB|nr:hypothetical protein C8N31_108200 [Sulfitobacter mediterraneus]